MTPAIRVRAVNDAPVNGRGRYVLYWMIAARRARSSHALDRAVAHARTLQRPLLVFEALRLDYPWASRRLHEFVIDGMADNARAFDRPGVRYLPYVEPSRGAGAGLLAALAADAALVVTDEAPGFFLPRMVAAAAARVSVRLEAVDGVGLLPLRAADRAFATAHAFRRHLQRVLPDHVHDVPDPDPFAVPLALPAPALPDGVAARWPDAHTWRERGGRVEALAIDQHVGPTDLRGGAEAGRARLHSFVREHLAEYGARRRDPARETGSRLSPYLHFGHVGAHEVFAAVMQHEGWLGALSRGGPGARAGWWGVSASTDAFLDQLVTWRELGANMCAHRADYDEYSSLPAWALSTLARHASDPRRPLYTPDTLDSAATHDPLWNAAQRQLRREGRIHTYLRMLWGKKVLEWSATPEDALATLIALNDRYAVDGRDPNSYSGIFWIFGRYDRPWGPERPIFGTVRYMSSENTARKLPVRAYLAKYAEDPPGLLDAAE